MEQVAQLRTIAHKIKGYGADLVLIGTGSPVEGREFLEKQKAADGDPEEMSIIRLLVNPGLTGYRAASLKRRLLAPYSPIGYVKGFAAWLRGFRLGKTAGDAYQLGGLFIITPEQSVEYSYVSDAVYDEAPLGEVLKALARIMSERGGSAERSAV